MGGPSPTDAEEVCSVRVEAGFGTCIGISVVGRRVW